MDFSVSMWLIFLFVDDLNKVRQPESARIRLACLRVLETSHLKFAIDCAFLQNNGVKQIKTGAWVVGNENWAIFR
ncbi:hypothetical protein, partial [Neisseria gonorrhoeae]|uniref:hypothetical protein n=1 Tax=Neisseria gonorrhoeae TaxID=485 RepID=UPI001C6A5D7F